MKITGVEREFKNIKQLVMTVLDENKESRDNDILLYVLCSKKLGAKTLDDLCDINLSFETVRRNRQLIQNEEGQYIASEEVASLRRKREVEVKEYIIKEKAV